jgi:hypothetical protein
MSLKEFILMNLAGRFAGAGGLLTGPGPDKIRIPVNDVFFHNFLMLHPPDFR